MKAVGGRASAFAEAPAPNVWAALIFGPDEGVVADTSRLLVSSWKIASEDIQTVSEDEVYKDPSAFFDVLEARALLGGDRCVRVRARGDKIAATLMIALKNAEADPQYYAAKLIIEADTLAKKSRLRKGFEDAAHAAALQVFEDETQDVAGLVTAELKAEDIDIEPEALSVLAATLPGHRSLARAEISKLSLYGRCLGRPLNSADIKSLSATDVDHAVATLVSRTLSGDLPAALNELDRLAVVGTSEITVLRALQRELERLQDAHRLMAGTGGGDIGMKLRPPVWKSDWPAFRQQASKWNPGRLGAALARVYDAEFEIKSAGGTARSVLRQLIRAFATAAG